MDLIDVPPSSGRTWRQTRSLNVINVNYHHLPGVQAGGREETSSPAAGLVGDIFTGI